MGDAPWDSFPARTSGSPAREHVLDGSACWCGFDPEEYARDQAAGVIGKTPTVHLAAMAVREHETVVAAIYNSGRADERRDVLAFLRADLASHLSCSWAADQIETLHHHPGEAEHVLSPDCWCHPTVEEVPGR